MQSRLVKVYFHVSVKLLNEHSLLSNDHKILIIKVFFPIILTVSSLKTSYNN